MQQNKTNELLHNKLVEEFGENYDENFNKPDKGFNALITVDGEQD